MLRRIPLLIIVTLATTQLFAHSAKRAERVAANPAYSSALGAANRFLHAWQAQDQEAGIMMLSDAARQHSSPEQLQEFFSPSASAAFEIQHGRKLNAGAYSFPVVLFGSAESHNRARVSRIVITKAGKEDWTVEKLP
jgi:hypothetical protein